VAQKWHSFLLNALTLSNINRFSKTVPFSATLSTPTAPPTVHLIGDG